MPVSKSDVIIVDRKFVIKNAEDVFYKYKAEIVEALRNNLIEKNKDQPGNLIQSIDVTITEQGSKITFELGMEDYWTFVDQGVDGTQTKHGSEYKYKNDGKPANLGAMLDFIKVRGIKPKAKAKQISSKGLKNKKVISAVKKVNRESKDKKLLSVAFAMGKHIKKHGIKPTHFFSEVVNAELTARLTADLSQALKRDIEVDIKASFNG